MKPELPRALKTATFRFAALGAGVFMVFAVFIVWVVYGSAETAIERQADRSLMLEAQDLSGVYARGGLNQVNRAVLERTLAKPDYLYLLSNPFGERISGGLTDQPPGLDEPGVPVRFVYNAEDENGEISRRRGRAMVIVLPGEFQLLIGIDVEQDLSILSRTGADVWRVLVLIGALSLLAGYAISRRIAARFDALDTVARRVMAGDLEVRAPRNNTLDEIDSLAASLNAMLERLQRLMTATRHAGDAIAHDLRTPLTRLRTRLEIAHGQDDPAQLREALADATENVDELLGTFDAVLRLSRLRAGERRAAFTEVDLSEVADGICDMYEAVAEDAGIDLRWELADKLTVRGDKALLSQALANLVDNAIKYTPEGGGVTVRLRLNSARQAELSVTDTGPGVPEDARHRITERFVRLDDSRHQPGSGLGLAMVQAVIDLHAGAFRLEDGAGATSGHGRGLRAVIELVPLIR